MHSDWLIVGHYSLIMPMGLRKENKRPYIVINNLLTVNVQTHPCPIDLSVTQSLRQGLDFRFSCKALTLG